MTMDISGSANCPDHVRHRGTCIYCVCDLIQRNPMLRAKALGLAMGSAIQQVCYEHYVRKDIEARL